MATNYIPQVDYTTRDYTSIREDLISLIKDFSPNWKNRDPADFGMTILEGFSYMGDLLNYYIDRAANEGFIGTASQRDNVLAIAKILGYKPTLSTAATVTLTLQNSTAGALTVPALSRFANTSISSASSNQIIFETDAEVIVPAKVGLVNGSITVSATQGITYASEAVGTSSGVTNQVFQLKNTPVIEGSISLVVGGINYVEVPYLIDYSGYDPVFSTYTNADGITYILFGDNISGRVPPNSAAIVATYRVGGGAEGNVQPDTIKSVISVTVPTGISCSNQYIDANDSGAATGGADEETTDSIRINAPLSVRALNRAVSISDYSALTVQVNGIAKANSIAGAYSSITVFFAPFGDRGVEADNVTPTAKFTSLAAEVKDFLVDKIPASTTVTYQPPSYVDVNINLTVTCLPQYRQSLVQTAVSSIISELLAFDNVAFGDRITLQDVITAVSSVSGVAYAQVSKLVRYDDDLTYTISNKAASGTEATLTTSAVHALTVGSTVLVSGVDATFNGTFIVTAVPTTTSFKYALLSSVVSSVAASGSTTVLKTTDVVCTVNEIPEAGTVTLTMSGGISS
jgi:hypothetical protein